jgi:hypothetical protein
MNIHNLSQLQKFLKNSKGIYYKFVFPNENRVRRLVSATANYMTGLNDENRETFFEWGKADAYKFSETGFVYQDDFNTLTLKWNVSDEEISAFENKLQTSIIEQEEKIKKQEIEQKHKELECIQKIQSDFVSHRRITSEDFLKLCDFHHIKMHIRTKGFFKKSVVEVFLEEDGVASYRYKKGTNSSFADHAIRELKNILIKKN